MQGRVLIVEDDSVLLDILVETFEGRGYSVHPSKSGTEALDVMETLGFDAVITDLVMDGEDGLAVLEKAREKNPEAAAVLLTGYGDMTSALRALRLSADDYILKPISAQVLADRVEEILTAREKRRREILAGLSLICCTRCQKIHDQEGPWRPVEEFLENRTGARVVSALCPECMKEGSQKPGGK
ncbi:MAG: response regulator [Proteobacteria bacterium]|nr:response regulator [Pseudomonadota bacterium]